MLVLSRKSGERIFVGANIEICVIRVQGGRVEIGIKAPRTVPVHREELLAGAQLLSEEQGQETCLLLSDGMDEELSHEFEPAAAVA